MRNPELDLMRRIAAKWFPDDAELLEIEGPVLIQELMQGRESHRASEKRDEFRFGLDDISEPIKLIAAVIGTAKTILDLISMRKKTQRSTSLDELQGRWVEKMCAEGVDALVADKIAREFRIDLQTIVDKL